MSEASVKGTAARAELRREVGRCLGLPVLVCSVVALAGCARVTPQQQRLVSKPNMQFSESLIFAYQNRLLTQIESGSASFTGAQSAGCSACGE